MSALSRLSLVMPTEVALTLLVHINACARKGFQEMGGVAQVNKEYAFNYFIHLLTRIKEIFGIVVLILVLCASFFT